MNAYIDGQQVFLRLQHLKDYLKILKMLQKCSYAEIINDPFKKGALLHYLQLSAEICIDVGQMIITAESFSVPEDSAQIFIILGNEKILNKKFALNFSAVARFRNLLVHEYAKIEMKKVDDYLRNQLGQFEIFAKAIVGYLKKKK